MDVSTSIFFTLFGLLDGLLWLDRFSSPGKIRKELDFSAEQYGTGFTIFKFLKFFIQKQKYFHCS